jgi:hypothetical protein
VAAPSSRCTWRGRRTVARGLLPGVRQSGVRGEPSDRVRPTGKSVASTPTTLPQIEASAAVFAFPQGSFLGVRCGRTDTDVSRTPPCCQPHCGIARMLWSFRADSLSHRQRKSRRGRGSCRTLTSVSACLSSSTSIQPDLARRQHKRAAATLRCGPARIVTPRRPRLLRREPSCVLARSRSAARPRAGAGRHGPDREASSQSAGVGRERRAVDQALRELRPSSQGFD